MKFKKSKNINTIEYFAFCICGATTCNCSCKCTCYGRSHSVDDYDKEYQSTYDSRYEGNIPAVERSYR